MSLRWLPNAISLSRIVLVWPILWLIVEDEFVWAFILIVVAGLSDGIDGYLAKRFDWGSPLGAKLDPIGDKVLIAGVFVTLSYVGLVPVWLTVFVFGRDIILVVGSSAINYLIRPFEGSPSKIAKLNTLLQLEFIAFVLCRAAFAWPDQIGVTVLGSAVLVTGVISMVDYMMLWVRHIQEEATHEL
jgi:cardiolipin synthase